MTMWTPKQEQVRAGLSKGLLKRVFGPNADHEHAYEHIEQGLSIGVLETFLSLAPGAAPEIGTVLKVSERTLTRRRSEGRLSPAESDRLYRLVALYTRATDVLESVEAADEWMTSPAIALDGHTPLEYARNEAGAQRVEALLTRLEYGVYS